jgi:multidrug efflux pump subunit AcrB
VVTTIQARNIIAPGGVFETGQRQITLNPSGQFENPMAIGDIDNDKNESAVSFDREFEQVTHGKN